MLEALKIYLRHKPNWFYGALFMIGLIYCLQSGALWIHWHLVLIVLALTPFIEYFTHKYVLHMPQPEQPQEQKVWAFVADRIHYLHHQDPKKVAHIFAEIWMTLPVLLLDLAVFWLITWDLSQMMVLSTTLVAYFLVYEWTHFVAHFDGYTPRNAYGKFLKKYHLWHHYKNEDYWFGITSPIADWFFGKWQDPHAIAVSELVMLNRQKRSQLK